MEKKVFRAVIFIVVANFCSFSAVVGQSKPATHTGRNLGFPLNNIEVSEKREVGGRIIGGHDTTRGKYPWQISLQLTSFFELVSEYHICGGTLYDDWTVICAAHCVDGRLPFSFMDVVAGAHNINNKTEDSQQRIGVKSYTIHPGYNSTTFTNDISIIKLAKPVFRNQYVQPIPRLASAGSNEDGKRCVNTGWGINNTTSGGTPAILQEVELTALKNDDCKQIYKDINDVDDGMICAAETGKGACNGDSGGPLLCYDAAGSYLCGITSWGVRGCPTGYPSVYTRVSKYLSFIYDESA